MGSSLKSFDTPEVCICIPSVSCLAANFNYCVIPSPWSVSNSQLTCFFSQVLFLTKFNDSASYFYNQLICLLYLIPLKVRN